jgi:proteic killer suppression protein
VIRTFRCSDTQKVFQREYSRRFHAIARIAKRKLDQLHAATSIEDLAAVPGNRLEALVGDRKGQHAIR